MAECLPRLNSRNPARHGARERAWFLCKSEAAAGTSAFEALYRNTIRASVSGDAESVPEKRALLPEFLVVVAEQ